MLSLAFLLLPTSSLPAFSNRPSLPLSCSRVFSFLPLPRPCPVAFPLLSSCPSHYSPLIHSFARSAPSFFLQQFSLPPIAFLFRSSFNSSPLALHRMNGFSSRGRPCRKQPIASGNNRLHPEITEPALPALERFLNKTLFLLPFFSRRLVSHRRLTSFRIRRSNRHDKP